MASDVRPARPPVIARGSRRVAARRAAATNEGFPSPASHRMAQLPPYILAKLNDLNAELRAKGVDVIDFGMGNPIDPVMPEVISEMKESLDDVANHRYCYPRGIEPLRKAFAGHYQRHFHVHLDPEKEILMSIGSKDALSHLCLAVLNPTDACVVPTPAYMIHRFAPVLAGAHSIGVQIEEEHPGPQLLTDIQNVFERVYPTPKILILNFPHNPTAKIVTLDFYEEAVAMAKHFKFWLINDFAYGHTCFDGYKAPSILQVKGAKDVAVETFTMSKPYNMAGWRLGFMAGNAQLVELLGRVKQYFDYGHFRCVQVAAAVALEKGDEAIRKQADIYRRRRDVFLKGLQDAGWGRTIKNRATMFTWQPLPEACKDMGSMEFAMQVAEKVGVSFLPGAGFGEAGEGYLRMALVEPEDRLREACRRVKKFLKG
jgi:alanine-synthesizing transaminase